MDNVLEQLDQQYVLHTYARNYTQFTHGHNATLYDVDARDYIDFSAGIAVSNIGHGNERLAAAIADQAKKLIHTSNLFVIEPQVKLAQKLIELSGFDMRCFFANSGAEANEGAIKIARRYGEVDGQPKRYKVITLENSFHGRTITALRATGQDSMHDYFGPYPDGFVRAQNLAEIHDLVDDHTVAVLLELVQGEGGIAPVDKEELQRLSAFLKEKNVLLMVDEVQTGIFRTGELFASTLYEIEPDVITTAKGLAGGVPIGAILTKHKEIFQPGDHGSTFGGNFLSTRAALETLEILEELKSSGVLDHTIIRFEEHLKRLAKTYPNLFEHEIGLGLMRGLRAKNDQIQKQVISRCFEERLIVLKAGKNFVRFLPPLTISESEVEEGMQRFEKALKRVEI